MKKKTYIGVMVPAVDADRFLTSIFQDDDGNFFTQLNDGETITGFESIILTRELLYIEHPVTVDRYDETIYSFITSKKRLIGGTRKTIEKDLLPLLYDKRLTDQAKLMISSFFQFYQKTIELIDATVKELHLHGIQSNLSSEDVLGITERYDVQTEVLLEDINARRANLHKHNKRIRIDDIVYISDNKAYFENKEIPIDKLANSVTLENKHHKKLVSELIITRADQDRSILKPILYDYDEAYYFVLYSEFIDLQQWQVESFLSMEKTAENDYPDIFDVGKDLDNRIHGTVSILDAKDSEMLEDDGSLDKSIEAIVNGENIQNF